MLSRFNLKTRDILTISSIYKKKNAKFLQHIRPINQNFLVNTIFKLNLNARKVNISGNWDAWKKERTLKKSENEFRIIIPLYPGFFNYKFTIESKLDVTIKNKNLEDYKEILIMKKYVKRLDNDMISSDSLLSCDIKTDYNFQKNGNEVLNEINSDPAAIPLHLLVGIKLGKKTSQKNRKYQGFFLENEYSETICFNHLIFYKNFFWRSNYGRTILVTKIKFQKKIATIYYFKFKKKNYESLINKVKGLFKLS